jgi:hypothetical protein
MLGKIFTVAGKVAFDGLSSLILVVGLFVSVMLFFWLLTIPVSIIGNDAAAETMMKTVEKYFPFRLVYAIVFASFVADDLGVVHLKTAVKRWWERGKEPAS